MTEKNKDPITGDEIVHEYDGIGECDNRLPNWWLATLFGAMAFAVAYWFSYDVFHFASHPRALYEQDMALERAKEAEKLKSAGTVTNELLLKLASDTGTVAAGREVFTQNCVPCHKEHGEGSVGPNLTDAYWLHGSSPESIHNTIEKGVLEKGMVAWGPQLGVERVRSVAAYVLTLKNTNAPGGKAPQGEKE